VTIRVFPVQNPNFSKILRFRTTVSGKYDPDPDFLKCFADKIIKFEQLN